MTHEERARMIADHLRGPDRGGVSEWQAAYDAALLVLTQPGFGEPHDPERQAQTDHFIIT